MKSDAVKFIQKKIIRILAKLLFCDLACRKHRLKRGAHFANLRQPRYSVSLISSISIETDFDHRRRRTPISPKRHA
jgi:hypothetical protein